MPVRINTLSWPGRLKISSLIVGTSLPVARVWLSALPQLSGADGAVRPISRGGVVSGPTSGLAPLRRGSSPCDTSLVFYFAT
jgi:hypothetical protein